jgi:hypothetical protein
VQDLPFKKAKNNDKAMPSMAKQKKQRDRPYMNVEMAMALHHQKMSVRWRDIHLPDGWLVKARRVSTPPVPHAVDWERRDGIGCQRAILPPDLWRDPTFGLDSLMRETLALEPSLLRPPRRHPGGGARNDKRVVLR